MAASSEPERHEVAALLVRRARGDGRAAEKLSEDPEIDDGVIGFHAQQAVEKSLKAALTSSAVEYPETHDIDFLVMLAGRGSIEVPRPVASAGWLTPWAAEFRYDDPPLESLDRGSANEIAGCAVEWAHGLVGGSQ
jgi:HEPN domain-containing protein